MKNKINENRPLAFIVLAVVVLLSIVLSGGGGLRSERSGAMNSFRFGVNNDGLCIYNDLKARADCAYNLVDLCARYDAIPQEIAQKAEQAADDLCAAGEDDVDALNLANNSLTRAVEALYTEIENASFTETDATFALSQYKEFTSRALTIARDGYNSQAEEFNRILEGFPASLVAKLSGVNKLSLFR